MVYSIITVIVIVVVAGALLSLASRNGSAAGVENDRLTPCPNTPNCVCSEYPQQASYVEALGIAGEPAKAWSQARQAVLATGGRIVQANETYLAAIYTSKLFRFVDDVELRLDAATGVIHIRSASRVGHSDFGANRRRVERIKHVFSRKSGGE